MIGTESSRSCRVLTMSNTLFRIAVYHEAECWQSAAVSVVDGSSGLAHVTERCA